jgi:hypothetical protein
MALGSIHASCRSGSRWSARTEPIFFEVPLRAAGKIVHSTAASKAHQSRRNAFRIMRSLRYAIFRDALNCEPVTARKDDAPAAYQAAITNLAGLASFSGGGGLIQTTSG